jgi:hypothetical protein
MAISTVIEFDDGLYVDYFFLRCGCWVILFDLPISRFFIGSSLLLSVIFNLYN